MAETKARHIANLVEDDGDVKSAHLDNKICGFQIYFV